MGLLLIDIGGGTQDIVLYRPGESWENSIQLVLPSPTVLRAGTAEEASARGDDLLFTGETMGGGPLTAAVRRHLLRGGRAWATPRAAATFDDDPDEVRSMGIGIVDEEEGARLAGRKGVTAIRTGDLDLQALRRGLSAWGISEPLGAAAVAVQDHGRAPRGTSDRRFRFAELRSRLERTGELGSTAYAADELPEYLTRTQAARRALDGLGPLLFMDTGLAALLGAMEDPRVGEEETKLLLNVGNSHTLAGMLRGERLDGLLEHHTRRLEGGGLGGWLDLLVAGEVSDGEVFGAGGHGAYLREGGEFGGWRGIGVFAATGPRRELASSLPRVPYPAAPHGQMMFTGNYGLYRAFVSRWGPYEG